MTMADHMCGSRPFYGVQGLDRIQVAIDTTTSNDLVYTMLFLVRFVLVSVSDISSHYVDQTAACLPRVNCRFNSEHQCTRVQSDPERRRKHVKTYTCFLCRNNKL